METKSIDELFLKWRRSQRGRLFRGSYPDESTRKAFLEDILKPAEDAIGLGICEGGVKKNPNLYRHFRKYSQISLKQAYDLFQELANLSKDQIKKGNWGGGYLEDVSRQLKCAGLIAQKVGAREISKRLFMKSAEALEEWGGQTKNTNIITERQKAFRLAGDDKKYAEIVERDYLYKTRDGSPQGSFEDHPGVAFYKAGQYDLASKYLPPTSSMGLAALRKAGKFGELANAYTQLSNRYREQGEEGLAKRFDANAKKALKKKLERRVSLIGIIGFLAGGLFFVSSNITGNVISNLSSTTSSFIGSILLIIGIIAGFFWIKNKEIKKIPKVFKTKKSKKKK
jgi:hypothetical protein